MTGIVRVFSAPPDFNIGRSNDARITKSDIAAIDRAIAGKRRTFPDTRTFFDPLAPRNLPNAIAAPAPKARPKLRLVRAKASPFATIFDPLADRNLPNALRITLPTLAPDAPTPAGWTRVGDLAIAA